MPQVSPILF